MMGDEPLDRLRLWFEKCDVPEGHDDVRKAGVEALERRTGLTLPEDFRRYLLMLSPGSENIDDEMTTWWPTGRIRMIPEEYAHPIAQPQVAALAGRYLFFADFSFWCWAWAIACTEDENHGRVVLIGASPDRFVAESFDAFVTLYLHDWTLVC